MLPPIQRKEWSDLIEGNEDSILSSHLLKIKIKSLRRKIKLSMLTKEQAILELYEDSKVHFSIYRKDLHKIFKLQNEKAV